MENNMPQGDACKDCKDCKDCSHSKLCKCPHHSMVPLLIMLIGFTFFAGAVNILNAQTVTIGWSILLMMIGAMKMMQKQGVCKCCSK